MREGARLLYGGCFGKTTYRYGVADSEKQACCGVAAACGPGHVRPPGFDDRVVDGGADPS